MIEVVRYYLVVEFQESGIAIRTHPIKAPCQLTVEEVRKLRDELDLFLVSEGDDR